jgi:hypothetical protein
MMTLVEIFKTPPQAVLDRSRFDETVLIFVQQRNDHFLQSISQKFSKKFDAAIKQRNWSIVIDGFRIINLGNQTDEGSIDGLQLNFAIIKVLAYVNTKIWYRKESDLWAQLGKKSLLGKEGFFERIR